MVELIDVVTKIDEYRNKYAQFFSIVQDEYFDKKSEIEDMCTYSYESNGIETTYIDKESLIELNDIAVKTLTDVFDKIANDNKNEYNFLLKLMYHDYVMMLKYDGNLTTEEKEKINEIKYSDDEEIEISINQLKEKIDNDPKFYAILVNYFIQFSDLDYYEVRKLFYDNEKRDKYLVKFFPCHLIDKLYFTRIITSNELIDEFRKGETVAQTEIIRKLQTLQFYDRKNYDMLVSEMLENFYKNISYKRSIGIIEDANYNLLKLLETGNITLLKDNVTEEFNSLKCLIQELYNDKKIYDEEFKSKANSYYLTNGQKVKEKILMKKK